jgi:hypothetical protein
MQPWKTFQFVLSIANGILVLGMAFSVTSIPQRERPGFIFIIAMLLMNFIYVVRNPPPAGSRLGRIVSLWLDAKERELRERAGKTKDGPAG